MVGHTNADGHQYLPRMLESLQAKTVTQVAACGFHTAALTDAGEIFTWGEGEGNASCCCVNFNARLFVVELRSCVVLCCVVLWGRNKRRIGEYVQGGGLCC